MPMYVEGDDDDLPVKISPAVETPKPKIVAPVLHPPVVTVEVNQPELKTVADPIPPEAKSEIPVPVPQPQKPVTANLDAPYQGDGVTGVACYVRQKGLWTDETTARGVERKRIVGASESNSQELLEDLNKQGIALNQFHKKNLNQGLR